MGDLFRFIWKEEEVDQSWEVQLAKRYYDKLFKEYCIIDLSRYKANQFGMRWRTEKEVVTGRGQFACANKKCEERKKLRTWEVNFGYVENNGKKNALVKCRLCFECSYKLNYHHKKKEVTKRKKDTKRKRKKGKKTRINSSSSSDSSSDERDKKSSNDIKTKKNDKEPEQIEKSASEVWSKPI